MKSIIQEASTISKAVDQAWQRAGKPQEFTIKIFEEPQHSIFGLTIRSAKIALFFNEQPIATQQSQSTNKRYQEKKQRPERSSKPQASPAHRQPQKARPLPAATKKDPVEKKDAPPSSKSQGRKRRTAWTDELITAAQNWIEGALKIIGVPNISYETTIIGNNLNIQFKNKLLPTIHDERLLFSSFAHLIMLALGQSFKRRFPNLKIILKSSN